MSFIYPRTVTISRPATLSDSEVGSINYQDLDASTETTIATNVAASIQQARMESKPSANLPGDIASGTSWNIFMPSLAKDVLQDNDIITDDAGIRYQVT